jgi:hypothetical protein
VNRSGWESAHTVDWDRPVIPDEREAAIIVRSTVRYFEAIEP